MRGRREVAGVHHRGDALQGREQQGLLPVGQAAEGLAQAVLEQRRGAQLELAAGVRDLDQEPPAVGRVGHAAHQVAALEPVQDARHGAGAEVDAARQLARREGAGALGLLQRRELGCRQTDGLLQPPRVEVDRADDAPQGLDDLPVTVAGRVEGRGVQYALD